MNFIKSIFENEANEDIHKQFRRFGKGTFLDRAAVEINVGKQVKVKTTFEYTNWFAKFLANTINNSCHVTGGIITTKDLRGVSGVEFSNVKQFAGVKTYIIDCDVKKEDILGLIKNYPDAVFCLSFSTDYGALKTKVKSPKSAKPGKDDKKIKVDYCTFTTKNIGFVKEFAFDIDLKFKSFGARHDFIINEIIVPEEYRNNPEMARVYARKKGRIIRKINIDGKEIVREIVFEA